MPAYHEHPVNYYGIGVFFFKKRVTENHVQVELVTWNFWFQVPFC